MTEQYDEDDRELRKHLERRNTDQMLALVTKAEGSNRWAVLGVLGNIVAVVSILVSAQQYVTKLDTRIALLEQMVGEVRGDHIQILGRFDAVDRRGEYLRDRSEECDKRIREHLNRHP